MLLSALFKKKRATGADEEIAGRAGAEQLADARLSPQGTQEGTRRWVKTHRGKTRLMTPF